MYACVCAHACRYKPLCPDTWPNWQGKLSDGVSTLVKHLDYKPEEYKLGRCVCERERVYFLEHLFWSKVRK